MVTITLSEGVEVLARVPARAGLARGDRVAASYSGEPTVAFSSNGS